MARLKPSLGRLRKACARAFAERDPSSALLRLRELYPHFQSLGPESAPLWFSFLNFVFDARILPYLGEADFDQLGAFGDHLAACQVIGWAENRLVFVEASAVRGTTTDLQRAYRLLTELYQATWLPDGVRLGAAARLASLKAVDETHLAVYADVLARQPQPPAEVTGLVGEILNIEFDCDVESLRLARSLAAWLGRSSTLAEAAFALGLAALRLHQDPQSAAQLFATALARDGGHTDALRGLLSAHLQAREFPLAITAARTAPVLSPRCTDLLMLCEVLAWLGDCDVQSSASAIPPATAERLAEIAPGLDVGPWRDYALGRLYLLDGDARQARQSFIEVFYAGLSDADVHYHAAWAELLCKNPDGVRADYDALAGAPGSWALGCLLQDAAPGDATLSAIPDGFEQVAAARQALTTRGTVPATLDVRSLFTSGAVQADLFEALRTALAVEAAHNRILPESLASPLFARLPAAERLLWTALSLRDTDAEESRSLLRRAIELGRDRAAVILALDAVRDGRLGEIRELLRDVPGPKAALLRGWADTQAEYALALRDAADAWARGDSDDARTHARNALAWLKTVSAKRAGRFKISLLKAAAESMVSAANPAELKWRAVTPEPWAARLIGLARLIGAPESVDVELFRRFTDWLAPETHGTALAQAALRVMLLSGDGAAREEAAAILIRLGERSSDADLSDAVRHFAARAGQQAGGGLDDLPDDPLATLVDAGLILGMEGRAGVLRRLRAVDFERGRANQAALVTVLASALEGEALPTPLPFTAPANVAAALATAAAIGQVAKGDAAAATGTLLNAFLAYKMDGLVDSRRVLPHVISHTAKRGRRDAVTAVFAPVMRQVVAEEGESGGDGDLAVACYATLLGDFETAEKAWRRLLEWSAADDGLSQELWGEYVRFVCHQAAVAYTAGDRSTALASMHTAALYMPEKFGRVFVGLELWHLVGVLVYTFFPDSPIVYDLRQGRLPRLNELIKASPDLKIALKSDTSKQVLRQWRLAVTRAGHDIELWHTLAILAREDAFARPVGEPSTDQARTTATALWLTLLTDPTLRAQSTGLTLPGEADEAFREEIIETLLADQKARLTEAVAQDDRDAAERCISCLNAVAKGRTATGRLLEQGPFSETTRSLYGDEHGFVPIAERARALIEVACGDLVEAASRTLTDGEAIRRLGEDSKLDKNYQAALRQLGIALLLDHPPNKVLCAALEWGYDWYICLENQNEEEAASAILDVIAPFAEHLAPRCKPGRGHTTENRVLGWYTYACGLTAAYFARKAGGSRRVELFEKAIALLERAYAWNSEWYPPKRDLCRVRGERLFALGKFAEAENVLRDLRDNNSQLGTLYNNYAFDCLRDARELLRNARSRYEVDAAFDREGEYERMLLQAGRVDPEDVVIRRNISKIKGIRQEFERKRKELG